MERRILSRRGFIWGTAGVALLGACSSGNNGTESQQGGSAGDTSRRTLRYHGGNPLTTLDPAKAAGWVSSLALAYDVLIYQAADGELKPQLAESWAYRGENNTTFEIVLKSDLSFADGTPVDAEAVKANIEYRLDPSVGSQSAAHLAPVTDVEIVDELTVRIHLAEPNPEMPVVFSQSQGGPGILINPTVLANPEVLATETHGVGRYKLESNETVAGDHYTFVSNPDYWNPDEVYWDKVVVHYMPEESAALSALQTGQLEAAQVSFAVVGAGKDAGLSATGPGHPILLGLSLQDRNGKVTPALADERVRKALNYAINREKITSAVVGESGAPTDQMTAPGHPGWHEEAFYPYDVDEARRLLAEAGHEDGFTLPVRVPRAEQHLRVTQAVADDLSEVSVELEITAVPPSQFDQSDDATNSDYAAVYLGWGVSSPVRTGSSFWLPDATNNTFDSADGELEKLHQQALVADEEARAGIYRQVMKRVADLAWFLPVLVHGESVLYHDETVEVPWTDFVTVPTISEIRPAA